MELDELKNTWTVLDEQLKKNEMLNKRIIQEMLYKKSNKSLSWLINTDFWTMLTQLLAIPICIWLYNNPIFRNNFIPNILFIFLIITMILASVGDCYRILKYLIKVDFAKSVNNNMHYVNKYAIWIKKEKIVSYFIVIPFLSLLGILYYYEVKATLSLWIFLVVALTFAIAVTYWAYKKIYDSNIQSIKKSLEELEELKEE